MMMMTTTMIIDEDDNDNDNLEGMDILYICPYCRMHGLLIELAKVKIIINIEMCTVI